jgi:methionyl-tRNA formyltransferase
MSTTIPAMAATSLDKQYRIYSIRSLEPTSDGESGAEPGTVIESTDDGFLIAVADGVVRVAATPIA